MMQDINCNPVKGPDGTIYISHNAAAKSLGVSKRTIGYHLDRWGSLDRIGRMACRLNHPRRKPVAIAGRTWPSVVLLAEYLGVSRPTVRNWLHASDMDRLMGALMKADAKAANVRVAA